MSGLIAILLATYNGERYLSEQVDSLLAQTDRDFVVLARDDGSIDGTAEVLAGYAARASDRFEILASGGVRLGPIGSFDALLQSAIADPRSFKYFMFCDQDDIWHVDKVARLRGLVDGVRDAMEIPLLGHCDMTVVGEDLRPVAPSFWRSQGFNSGRCRLNRLLMVNQVTGHASIFNRRLAILASPIPADAIMHDWWLALVAVGCGQLVSLDLPLSLYRQHTTNTLGYRSRTISRFLSARHWQDKILQRSNYAPVFLQADLFLHRFWSQLHPVDQRLLRLKGVSQAGYFGRLRRILRARVYPRNAWDFMDMLLKA